MGAEESRTVARRYFEEFQDQRRDDILEQIVAADLLGPTRAATERVRQAFPDVRFKVEAQVAEDDKVATVWSARGTHRGDWESPIGTVPATGRQVAWTATTTLRIERGKIAEVLGTNWDHLGILQQLGAVAERASRPGA